MVAKILGWEEYWWFIGCLHNMESTCHFGGHLHNGDTLKAQTTRVPAGRPTHPPKNGWDEGYTWEESALDAMRLKEFDSLSDQSIAAWLWRAELYNGFGYLLYHPEINTPYLWSGTNHYSQGKYIADGSYSATATSSQVGVAAIAKHLLPRLSNSKITTLTAPQQRRGFIEITGSTKDGYTWAKTSAKQNILLSESEKCKLAVGNRLEYISLQEQDGHYVIELPLLLVSEDGKFSSPEWFIFRGHAKTETIKLPEQPQKKPTTLAEKVVAVCEKRKFPLARKPGEINIIGLEGVDPDGSYNNDAADKWNDSIGLLSFDNGTPRFDCLYRGTTEPGRYYTIVRILNPNGAARIDTGYHPGIWEIGLHRGYQALVQAGNPIRLVRDRNRNFSRDDKQTTERWKGVNLHHGNNCSLNSIGRWSAGCTVIRLVREFNDFLNRVKSSAQYRRNRAHKFDYILLWRDWLKEV